MSATTSQSEVEALAEELARRGARDVRLAVVLGSGLGAFADVLDAAEVVAAADLEHLPGSKVPGHAGRIVVGELDGARILVQQGRVHLYEGWSVLEVTRAVRACACLGARGLLLTNAAGGLVREWLPGTLMRFTDHIDRQCSGPLLRSEAGAGVIYDQGLGAALDRAATEAGIELRAGVYAGLPGPSYETPAEIRMLSWMGADAVGMSTVAEAAAGRAAGLRVAALSCITNHAAGVGAGPLAHDEVLAVGRAATQRFVGLLRPGVAAILAELG